MKIKEDRMVFIQDIIHKFRLEPVGQQPIVPVEKVAEVFFAEVGIAIFLVFRVISFSFQIFFPVKTPEELIHLFR